MPARDAGQGALRRRVLSAATNPSGQQVTGRWTSRRRRARRRAPAAIVRPPTGPPLISFRHAAQGTAGPCRREQRASTSSRNSAGGRGHGVDARSDTPLTDSISRGMRGAGVSRREECPVNICGKSLAPSERKSCRENSGGAADDRPELRRTRLETTQGRNGFRSALPGKRPGVSGLSGSSPPRPLKVLKRREDGSESIALPPPGCPLGRLIRSDLVVPPISRVEVLSAAGGKTVNLRR